MLTEASAIGGRTARACDGCMLRRASWFCASDDAFLCHACDASVHSANQLVSRHERVRISTAEASKPGPIELFSVADWHQKVTRRARTPRNGVKAKAEVSSSVVPEIGVEEELICENGDLLVFQVPVFDADCCFWNEDESASVEELHSLLDFVPDDIQFSGGDEEGLFMCEDGELEMLGFKDSIKKSSRVKREEDDVIGRQFDAGVRTLWDWDFGLESDEMAVKEEEEEEGYGKRRMLLLKLNCEEVVSAWDEHGCPWMNGARPELDALGDGWVSIEFLQGIRETNGGGEEENGGRSLVVSEERIARVRRYREKRRRRLFSKKIRYEVRKVNAEKRPRMKGRFCKRVQSYVGPQVTSLK